MVEMKNEITETEIKLAWSDWEEDQKTNPSPVNPHAFIYGWQFGWVRKNKELEEIKAKYSELHSAYVKINTDNAKRHVTLTDKYNKLKEAFENVSRFAAQTRWFSEKYQERQIQSFNKIAGLTE